MKRFFVPLAAIFCSSAVSAQVVGSQSDDSMRLYQLQQVEVISTRATGDTPVAYTDLSREEIARGNYGYDVPYLLEMTPSFVATSGSGIGIGSISMRLRGTEAQRLNVTANGVPMNNPDSHEMYWYDTPDFVSSTGSVQVQRGAGVSTNGTGAFGGAVNMTTAPLSTRFGGDASFSYGSYRTNKQALHVGSGLMGGHWIVDGRLSHISSDGYADRTFTKLYSYMFQTGYFSNNTVVKLLSFGGKVRTYLTYDGVTKADMEKYGRRYHTSGQYYDSEGNLHYYDDETDNYLQINNQLLVSHRFSDRWSMNVTGYYTYGYGFYKQYKDDAWLAGYDNLTSGSEVSDLIREKIMRNHFGGVNASAAYTARKLSLWFGGSWSYYTCPHWGELDWVENAPANFQPGYRWYDNDVDKQDANLFVRADWEVANNLHLFGDLQYRYVSYKAWGVNDNYDWNTGQMQPIDVDERYHFVNPHVGLSYSFKEQHRVSASSAVAQKEPTRNDFTDRFTEENPTSERLYDWEAGYQFSHSIAQIGVNFYYMQYKDQLVKTGLINDAGDALNINVPDSYRRGVELTASFFPLRWLSVGGNATYSGNAIRDYVDLMPDSPTYGQNLGKMKIAYSPDWIAGLYLDFHVKGFSALLTTRYVGKQYFSNTENEALSLDAYCVSNLNLAYEMPLCRRNPSRTVRFGLAIYNLFDAAYCNNGYGYSVMEDGKQADYAYYYPQAPTHLLFNVTFRF